MKKIFLILILLIPLSINAQYRPSIHFGYGLCGYNGFGDGQVFAGEIQFPVLRSLYVAPSYTVLTKNSFRKYNSDIRWNQDQGFTQAQFLHEHAHWQQTTSFRLFLYLSPFSLVSRKSDPLDLRIGLGAGMYHAVLEGYLNTSTERVIDFRHRSAFNILPRMQYFYHKGNLVFGIQLGYELSYVDDEYNPFVVFNLGFSLGKQKKD